MSEAENDTQIKIFAVAGNPVIHSQSPQIFNQLFQIHKMKAEYIRINAENAEAVMAAVKAVDIKGFNVTSPFKKNIMNYLDKWEEDVDAIGAVNTVVTDKRRLIGYNTDHIGVVETLKAHGIDPQNKKALILGAGGAARAAAFGLAQSHAQQVVFSNRTEVKAKDAAKRLGCDYVPLSQAERVLSGSDILISCVSTPQPLVSSKALKKNLVVLDANYRNSSLSRSAIQQGCLVLDGKEWLLRQAFPAFSRFTGKRVDSKIQARMRMNMSADSGLVKTNLALIGFMGTGKTRIGKLLAAKMGIKFVDIDHSIEESTGVSVSELFQREQEESFRKIEKKMIRQHIPPAQATIFSLGGGAVLDKENRSLLKRHCRVVWLWAAIPTIWQRIDKGTRPLLNLNQTEAGAQTLLSGRISLYARASDLFINTETGSPDYIAERIKNEMD